MVSDQEFTFPLHPATPHMKGPNVKDAQYLMAGHSRFPDVHTYEGAIDGDYGPESWQATALTKYWLGYHDADCNHSFGQTLYEYLRPKQWRPLPDDYRTRREARLKAAALTPGMKALAFAQQFVGYQETPVNHTLFGRWYGFDGVPWCAIFESYCFGHTGRGSYHYAAVEQIYYDAINGRNGLHITHTPARGDVVLYSFGNDRFAHTGFFDHWIVSGREFQDLAGNTGSVNHSNGGEVAYGSYATNVVLAYVHVS